jgi:hypothetical protein
MRKRLVALLSLVGLASSSTPAASQVLKGSNPAPETKNESQVKLDKSKQENAGAQNDASKKLRKAGGEQQAAQDVVTEKVGADQITHKHIKRIKHKEQMGDGSVKPGAQATTGSGEAFGVENPTTIGGAGAGKTKVQDVHIKKAVKATSEASAIQSGIQDKRGKTGEEARAANASIKAKDKWKKANTQMGDGSVVKGEKIATENNALKQDAAKKAVKQQNATPDAQKQIDKASPK